MEEKWADISEYKNIYEVSNLGRIRTHVDKTTYTEKHGIRHWKQRILKPKGQTYATGYRVSLWKDGEQKDFLVSRLVAFTLFNEDINNHKLTVNHIDGNRFNNHIDNLELISLADNIRHGFETGLFTCCKKTILKNVITKETNEFHSMSKASEFLGKDFRFISGMIKKNIFYYRNYIIEIIEGE